MDCCARLAFAPGFGFCRELLRFFMAGLLCTSSAYLGAYRLPWTPAFSFHLGECLRQRLQPLGLYASPTTQTSPSCSVLRSRVGVRRSGRPRNYVPDPVHAPVRLLNLYFNRSRRPLRRTMFL